MKIGLIGCGRLGLTIGYFLKKSGNLYGLYDIDKKALTYAVKILKLKNNPDYKELIKNCDILLFATPDDRILNAFNQAKKFITDKKFLFHFSGLLSAEIFPANKNIHRAALHPFATFPRISIPPSRRRYTLFFQGDKQSYHIARKIFSSENFQIRLLKREQKPVYHLAGVFSSNLIVTLTEAILHLTRRLKWRKADFDALVFPMMIETITNVKKYGIKNGLSGPIVRGDIASIKKHLKILKKTPELYRVYRDLSRIIIKYAPSKKQKQLKRILALD